MSTIELHVQDMSCGACVKHVSEALSTLPGVEAVEVDLQTGRVSVRGSADVAALITALDEAGYSATQASAPGAASPACCGGCGCH